MTPNPVSSKREARPLLSEGWRAIIYVHFWKIALTAGLILIVLVEYDRGSTPFVLFLALALASLAAACTARVYLSCYFAIALLGVSAAVSLAKYRYMGVSAHVFDISFYLAKPETRDFLIEIMPVRLALGALALVVVIGLGVVIYRREKPVRGWRPIAFAVSISSAIAAFAVMPKAEDIRYYGTRAHFASSFFVSLQNLAHLFQPDALAAHLEGTPAVEPFRAAAPCTADADAPDIFLVLSESGVPPSTIPGWPTPPELTDAAFASFDGKMHGARVETYGGGTWISHMSVMTGLSMEDFGWRKPYVTMALRGKLRHGLPQALAACGYETSMISPARYGFVHEGPMLRELGIQHFVDRTAMRSPGGPAEDKLYYRRALDLYESRQARTNAPQFMFIATMAAHMPYDWRLAPERQARGDPLMTDPMTNEYLRRLTFAREDFKTFVAGVARLRKRPALIVEFGDHQPGLTQQIFEQQKKDAPLTNPKSAIFHTYYSVTPLGFAPQAALPKVDYLDLAFLGSTLLEVAGLPLDPVFAANRDLRDHCDGAFQTCADRAAVDRYLKRMTASGALVLSHDSGKAGNSPTPTAR